MCGLEWESESKAENVLELVWQLVREFQVVHVVSDFQINVFKQLWKTVSVQLLYFEFCQNRKCLCMYYRRTICLWDAGLWDYSTGAHWIDKYTLYPILIPIFIWYIHIIVLQYGNSLYTVHLNATLKKEAISKQFYTFEYVTWPHEDTTYVNSILSVFNWSHQCLIVLSKRYSYDSCVYRFGVKNHFWEERTRFWVQCFILKDICFDKMVDSFQVCENVIKWLRESVMQQ